VHKHDTTQLLQWSIVIGINKYMHILWQKMDVFNRICVDDRKGGILVCLSVEEQEQQ
jgi:hypothetical protein